MKRIVYWDSDAFLRLLNGDGTSAEISGCEDVWATCQKGTAHLVTSTLTIAEIIHKKSTPKMDPIHRPLVNNFFRDTFISLKPLTREIAELARDVVWDSNIMPKDAIHVATCAYFKIRELHSFDRNLTHKKEINVDGFVIQVSNPYVHGQSELLLEHKGSSKRER